MNRKKLADKIEEKEEDKEEDVSTAIIKEIISKWIDLQNIAEEYHPDTMIKNGAMNIFIDNVMAHFRKILKH